MPPPTAGFAALLALRAAAGKPIAWVRQDYADVEAGALHAPGLAELGLDPDRLILVRARNAADVLRAGAEAVRCPALGAVLMEPWGEPRVLDLTATRRLSLAAAGSGVTLLLDPHRRPARAERRPDPLVRPRPPLRRAGNECAGPARLHPHPVAPPRRGAPPEAGIWSGTVTNSPSAPRRYLALFLPFLPAERLRRLGTMESPPRRMRRRSFSSPKEKNAPAGLPPWTRRRSPSASRPA